MSNIIAVLVLVWLFWSWLVRMCLGQRVSGRTVNRIDFGVLVVLGLLCGAGLVQAGVVNPATAGLGFAAWVWLLVVGWFVLPDGRRRLL